LRYTSNYRIGDGHRYELNLERDDYDEKFRTENKTSNVMEGWEDGDEGSSVFVCEKCNLSIENWKTFNCKGRENDKYYHFKYCPECGRKIIAKSKR
jgi:hypothetical protein